MSELQTAITNLQLKHSELVAAVKSYPGTVASAANEAVGEASVEQRKVRDTVRSLRDQIENDGQSLILDWEHDAAVVNGEGKPINEVVEFSRSTGGGRFGPDGKYEWVEAGVPRIDYDLMTGECRGLLVEEQRTNLATGPYSGFHNGNGTGVTYESVPPFLSAPGVTPDAVRVSTTGAGATRFQYSSRSQAVGELLTMSWYERYVDYTPAVGTSALSIEQSSGMRVQIPLTMQEVKPGIFKATVTMVATLDGTGIFRLYFSKFSNVLNAVEFWAFQIEEGSYPTSYIPTEGSSVTRAADVVKLNTVVPWFNRSEGTFFMEVGVPIQSYGTRRLLSSGGNARFFYRVNGQGSLVRAYTGTDSNSVDLPQGTTPKSLALSFTSSGYTLAANGVVSATAQGGKNFREITALDVFHTENGHVKRLEYFPRTLSESELQELTSL